MAGAGCAFGCADAASVGAGADAVAGAGDDGAAADRAAAATAKTCLDYATVCS